MMRRVKRGKKPGAAGTAGAVRWQRGLVKQEIHVLKETGERPMEG